MSAMTELTKASSNGGDQNLLDEAEEAMDAIDLGGEVAFEREHSGHVITKSLKNKFDSPEGFDALEDIEERNGEGVDREADASDGEENDRGEEVGENEGEKEGSSSQPMIGGSIVGDVLYSIATGEEEGRSRQRILAFAAKRYQNAVERNPEDYDALYNWALVLQESADNCSPDTAVQAKDILLEDACRKYAAATALCPTLHEAFYNWAIAISDRAKIRGRTLQAEELWKEACEKYDKAVRLNWDSPQALNNWGLALQELGGIVPTKEKRAIVQKAISKFRSAIRLRFDFHRAVYNLGTVLYGLAEDTLKSVRKVEGQEHPSDALYSQSAIYIAAAHSLKADYPVYRNALRLVRTMLPLPFLKSGYLTVAPNGNSLSPHTDWQKVWVALDHEAIYQVEKPDVRHALSSSGSRRPSKIANEEIGEHKKIVGSRKVSNLSVDSSTSQSLTKDASFYFEMSQVLSVSACGDLSLPAGGGMLVETTEGPFYMVAETWEAMDGWVDAIRLVYTIFVRGKAEALAGVLAG